jgi:hypothetical protein
MAVTIASLPKPQYQSVLIHPQQHGAPYRSSWDFSVEPWIMLTSGIRFRALYSSQLVRSHGFELRLRYAALPVNWAACEPVPDHFHSKIIQVYVYGTGTKWSWFYLPIWLWEVSTVIVHLVQFRYDKRTWDQMECVKLWKLWAHVTVVAELVVPLVGFFTTSLAFLVPWRSPANTVAFWFLGVCFY